MTGADIRNMLAKRLKILRREKGFSQAQLAEKADISVPFLSSIERGAKWPYPETLAKLADALDADIGALFSSNTGRGNTDCTADILRAVFESQQKAMDEVCRRFLG